MQRSLLWAILILLVAVAIALRDDVSIWYASPNIPTDTVPSGGIPLNQIDTIYIDSIDSVN